MEFIFLRLQKSVISVYLFFSTLEKNSLQAKINATINIPLKKYLTYRMNMFGGFSIGNQIPYFYTYRFGGLFEQNLGNFIAFSGNNFGEESSQNLLSTSVILEGNYNKKFYLSTNFDFANPFFTINIKELFTVKKYGLGITAGYKSPFGQIKLNYSTDSKFNKKIFNVILGHWF